MLPVAAMRPIVALLGFLDFGDKHERRITSTESVARTAGDTIKRRVGIVGPVVKRAGGAPRGIVFADCRLRTVRVCRVGVNPEARPVDICSEKFKPHTGGLRNAFSHV